MTSGCTPDLSFPRDPNVEDDIERALDHALAAAALRPTSARALCQAAERLRDLRRFEHALAYTREAQRLAREDAGVLVNHGAAAFDAKDLAEAERAWERATELDPRHVPALLNLAVVYERRGDPEKALDTRERVLEMDPRDARARLAVAHSYGRLGRSEESVAMARRVVEERPRHADAWCTISGGLQQYQGPSAEMRQEAVTAAEKAVALAPRDAANHAVLASALMGVARAEEAMDEVSDGAPLGTRERHRVGRQGPDPRETIRARAGTGGEPTCPRVESASPAYRHAAGFAAPESRPLWRGGSVPAGADRQAPRRSGAANALPDSHGRGRPPGGPDDPRRSERRRTECLPGWLVVRACRAARRTR